MAGGDVIGKLLAEVLHPEDALLVQQAMATASDRLPAAEVRIVGDHRTEPLWAALNGSLIEGKHDRLDHFCIEFFDLTERRRVARARNERARAESADRAKSDLLALVSHELRTPLNAVIGFAQLLDKRELPQDRQREAVAHILHAGQHVLRLINDLIDLTGAETGQLQLALEPVTLSEIVEETTKMLAGLAREQDIELRVFQKVTNTSAIVDRLRLRQVLLNLVGNSIKFTPSGGTVSISIDGDGVLVRDTGPGIDPDQLPHVFKPFHRAGDSGAEGSGLGLALSQRLTAAMGGRLCITTDINAGTTVRVQLATSASAAVTPIDHHPSPLEDLPEGYILYVEDDPASQKLLVSALDCWPDVTVDVRNTLASARAALKTGTPDLVIADVELPDGSGWELIRDLAGNKEEQLSKVIVVTAGNWPTPSDLESVEVHGKPLLIDILTQSIWSRLVDSARP